jgi:hypothetical protein
MKPRKSFEQSAFRHHAAAEENSSDPHVMTRPILRGERALKRLSRKESVLDEDLAELSARGGRGIHAANSTW